MIYFEFSFKSSKSWYLYNISSKSNQLPARKQKENKLKRVWLFQLGTIFKILISHYLYHTDHSAAVTGDWISLINLRSQVVLH